MGGDEYSPSRGSRDGSFGPLATTSDTAVAGAAEVSTAGEWREVAQDSGSSNSTPYPWGHAVASEASFLPCPIIQQHHQGALNFRKKRSSSHLPSPPDNKVKKSPDLSHAGRSGGQGSSAAANEEDWQAVDLSSSTSTSALPSVQPPIVDFESDIDVLTLESPTRSMPEPFPELHHHHHPEQHNSKPQHEQHHHSQSSQHGPGPQQREHTTREHMDNTPDDSDIEVLSVVPPR